MSIKGQECHLQFIDLIGFVTWAGEQGMGRWLSAVWWEGHSLFCAGASAAIPTIAANSNHALIATNSINFV